MPDFGRWTGGGGDPSLNEINRADRFIDALSTTQPVYSTDPAEAELAFLLSDWRDEVRDAPITAPVSDRDAVVALDGATSRRRSRGSLALVGSVAAAMLCVGGFGAAVYGSGPGDSLYGMRSSLFGTQQVTRDDQVSLASAQLQQVQQLIDQGQWQQAQDKLVEVSSAVQNVDQTEGKQDLVEQWNALTYKVVEQNPAATLPPGEPLPVLPSSPLTWLPMPVIEATTESATTESTAPTETTAPSGITTAPATSTTGTPGPEILMTSPTPTGTSTSPGQPTSPIPTPSASPIPTPSASPIPTPSALPTPKSTPSAAPIPTPSASPIPTPSASPIPTPSASPIPTPSALPKPTPSQAETTTVAPEVEEEPQEAVTTTVTAPVLQPR